jgi:hypothetical protein
LNAAQNIPHYLIRIDFRLCGAHAALNVLIGESGPPCRLFLSEYANSWNCCVRPETPAASRLELLCAFAFGVQCLK